MTALGSQSKTIEAALYPWARIICFDMARVHAEKIDALVKAQLQGLEVERQRIPQPIEADDPVFAHLNARIASLLEFQNNRLRKLHLLALEDYPDKFMSLFGEVPQIEPDIIESLRTRAALFAPGMQSLRKNRTLADTELWIAELDRAREE